MKQKIKNKINAIGINEVTKHIWDSKNHKFSRRFALVNMVKSIHENKCSENVDYDDLSEIFDIISRIPQGKVFSNKEELADFLAEIGVLDKIKEIPDELMEQLNGLSEYIYENKLDVKNVMNWNPSVSKKISQLVVGYCESNKIITNTIDKKITNYGRNVLSNYVCEGSGKDLHKMIYEVLDDNSILLIYGFINGKYPSYSRKMRDEVYQFLSTHTSHPAYDMVVGAVDYSKVFESKNFKSIDLFEIYTSRSPVIVRKTINGDISMIEYKDNAIYSKSI